jgi:putative transcriptional regulator
MCNLKQIREAAGITQADLAEAIGMTQGAIGHYESGRRTPGVRECRLILAALRKRKVKCTFDQLFPAEVA